MQLQGRATFAKTTTAPNATTATRAARPRNGWRLSGERKAERDERVRGTRVLASPMPHLPAPTCRSRDHGRYPYRYRDVSHQRLNQDMRPVFDAIKYDDLVAPLVVRERNTVLTAPPRLTAIPRIKPHKCTEGEHTEPPIPPAHRLPNGWRISRERRAEGEDRVRSARVLDLRLLTDRIERQLES